MSRRIVLRAGSSDRKQPLLHSRSVASGVGSGGGRCARFGEVCGATTAECAAICCCCPCGLATFLLLVVYKVPAGLCRLALRKKRLRKQMKKGLVPQHRRQCVCDGTELQIHPVVCIQKLQEEDFDSSKEETEDALLKLEKEMWDRFYGAGFWRSPSERESISSNGL